jgi:hypothetical protein
MTRAQMATTTIERRRDMANLSVGDVILPGTRRLL